MRKLMSKKTAAVVAPLAILGVAGVAYAASLTVTSDTLAAGDDAVTSECNLTATYAPVDLVWSVDGYKVEKVTVTPSSDACAGETFKVTITGNTSSSSTVQKELARATGTFAATGTTAQVVTLTDGASPAVDTPVIAEDVKNVFAVVTGTASN